MDGIEISKKIIAGMISQVQIFLDLKQINVTNDLLYAVIQHVRIQKEALGYLLMSLFYVGYIGCKILFPSVLPGSPSSSHFASFHFLQPSGKQHATVASGLDGSEFTRNSLRRRNPANQHQSQSEVRFAR